MKKLKKDMYSMIGTGIGLGIGADVITSVGGNAASLGAIGKQMPVMGSIIGAGAVMRNLNRFKTKKKRY